MILIVDDERPNRMTIRRVLERDGHRVQEAANGQAALELLEQETPTLMITDLMMPEVDGIQLLRRVKSEHPSVEVIMITAHGTIERAVEAMREGAWDFIAKPIKRNDLIRAVHKALAKHTLTTENHQLRRALAQAQHPNWIAHSAIMRTLSAEASHVADSFASVFLEGSSGTGKSMLAKWIHERSPCRDKKMVVLNCGAIPESLMESELFGHEKGAFTGANQRRIGKFEQANGSTLFLDEVTEMSSQLQVKLLRVLQDGSFERVGGNQTLRTNVRLIAATNREPSEAIASGKLREDLFYRLNVVQLELPDLKQRIDDIPPLVSHFITRHSQRNRRNVSSISPEALSLLQSWSWPGNVRELENVIERAVVLCRAEQIEVRELPQPIRGHIPEDRLLKFPVGSPIKLMERRMIEATLELVDGDKNIAAEMLGLTARTLYRRIDEWKAEEN